MNTILRYISIFQILATILHLILNNSIGFRSQTKLENGSKYENSAYPPPATNGDEGHLAYNKIFPNGMEPPILDQRNKRDRRLSSIVGIKNIGYGQDYEVEELLENRGMNNYKQDSTRKISIDYFKLHMDKKE